jgi:hypothetical protein
MAETDWFYVVAGRRSGPVTLAELSRALTRPSPECQARTGVANRAPELDGGGSCAGIGGPATASGPRASTPGHIALASLDARTREP